MTPAKVEIATRHLSQEDAQDLFRFLKSQDDVADVRKQFLLQEAVGAEMPIVAIVLSFGSAVAVAAGKKVVEKVGDQVIDAAIEKVKIWLKRKPECAHRELVIYGPDGTPVKVVECEDKHLGTESRLR